MSRRYKNEQLGKVKAALREQQIAAIDVNVEENTEAQDPTLSKEDIKSRKITIFCHILFYSESICIVFLCSEYNWHYTKRGKTAIFVLSHKTFFKLECNQ